MKLILPYDQFFIPYEVIQHILNQGLTSLYSLWYMEEEQVTWGHRGYLNHGGGGRPKFLSLTRCSNITLTWEGLLERITICTRPAIWKEEMATSARWRLIISWAWHVDGDGHLVLEWLRLSCYYNSDRCRYAVRFLQPESQFAKAKDRSCYINVLLWTCDSLPPQPRVNALLLHEQLLVYGTWAGC